MLRINMAVPVTPRNSPDFSSEGLLQAAVLGLTDPRFNTTADLQFIPNMDGFPNGRRLEDDATRIELQAAGGIVLAVLGLWYDDFKPGISPSVLTPDLLNVVGYSTGIGKNDVEFRNWFPFEAAPFSGTHKCACADSVPTTADAIAGSFPVTSSLGIATPEVFATASPNPVVNTSRLTYRVQSPAQVTINVVDLSGKTVRVLADKKQDAGNYTIEWNTHSLAKGSYFISISKNGVVKQTLSLIKAQ